MLKNDCVPKLYDVLVAKDGSYLKEIFVNEKENKKAILSSIAIFRPNQDVVDPYFLCYLLKNYERNYICYVYLFSFYFICISFYH